MRKAYCLFPQAVETLAVTPEFLARRLRGTKLLVAHKDNPDVPLVSILDVGLHLGIPEPVMQNVANGREWLMTGAQIEKVYGLKPSDTKVVTGGPVLVSHVDRFEVFVVSPVVQFLALDPREQRQKLEGSYGKVQDKRVRSKARMPR